MPDAPSTEDQLVATMILLIGAHGRAAMTKAMNRATMLPEHEQRRLVCSDCGSDDISFNGPSTWDAVQGKMVTGDMERCCWCNDCSDETSDLEVAFDYVHPNKSLDETHR